MLLELPIFKIDSFSYVNNMVSEIWGINGIYYALNKGSRRSVMSIKTNYILLFGLVFLIGCSDDSGTTLSEPRLSQNELTVIENCHIVQEAVEKFRDQMELLCPSDTGWDATYCGESLIDLLPGGVLIENPYTQNFSEPSENDFGCPGEISYEAKVRLTIPVGYKIKGYGDESDKVIFEVTSYNDERELDVIAACMLLYTTVFSAYTEDYPADLSAVSTQGKTLSEHMDQEYLVNPYTNTGCSFVSGIAQNPGEVGYLPVTENDVVIGCIITGVGERENELIFYINYPSAQPCH